MKINVDISTPDPEELIRELVTKASTGSSQIYPDPFVDAIYRILCGETEDIPELAVLAFSVWNNPIMRPCMNALLFSGCTDKEIVNLLNYDTEQERVPVQMVEMYRTVFFDPSKLRHRLERYAYAIQCKTRAESLKLDGKEQAAYEKSMIFQAYDKGPDYIKAKFVPDIDHTRAAASMARDQFVLYSEYKDEARNPENYYVRRTSAQDYVKTVKHMPDARRLTENSRESAVVRLKRETQNRRQLREEMRQKFGSIEDQLAKKPDKKQE